QLAGCRGARERLLPGGNVRPQPALCLLAPALALRLSETECILAAGAAGKGRRTGRAIAVACREVVRQEWVRAESVQVEASQGERATREPAGPQQRHSLVVVLGLVLPIQEGREVRQDQGLGLAAEHVRAPIVREACR